MAEDINELVRGAHKLAVEKGWWPKSEPVNIPEKLALIHSEVSEALEAYRESEDELDLRLVSWGPGNKDNDKPEGFAVELADAVIRIADLCGKLGIDLQEAIHIKMRFNASRPHRHGGKRC
jgi:NTP pyrophosphatase (non-canonical NTP hydrolase)